MVVPPPRLERGTSRSTIYDHYASVTYLDCL
jgi:hypothetical protein